MTDKKLPSVSEIIREVLQKTLPSEFYLQRGQTFHKIIELHFKGTLDVKTIDQRLLPFYAKFIDVINVLKVEPVLIEQRLEHSILQYSGTVDVYDRQGRLFDFKTNSIPAEVELQLGGYAELLKHNKYQVKMIYAVCIQEKGYKIEKYNISKAINLFKNVLAIYNWKKEVEK